ncbi:TRAP transporter small permease [Reyranella sp. CPCC 100927]|uniref:TRAP transporter small permease n=1 Tax=Reyranella sp. CPCC 100927 TaxID=2599616 RepID=UPI0011B61BF7|nr:TRAP transporter small permease [Reyranella sp. CPCC 100927]TWT13616.1 TRAP transporter small permease [Reyranella sp. CPCC 100927]
MGDSPGAPARGTSLDVVVERWASRTLGIVAALTLFAMMVLTFVDVWGRYLLRQPVFGGYEVTEFLMGVLIFSGLPILCAREGHVSIDVFDPLIPKRWRRPHLATVNLVSAVALGVLAWRMFIQAAELSRNHEVTMTLKIPHGPFALLFAVLSAAACLACLAVFWAYLRGARQPIEGESAT